MVPITMMYVSDSAHNVCYQLEIEPNDEPEPTQGECCCLSKRIATQNAREVIRIWAEDS